MPTTIPTDAEKIKEIKAIYMHFRQQINQLKSTQNQIIKDAIQKLDQEHAEAILKQIKDN